MTRSRAAATLLFALFVPFGAISAEEAPRPVVSEIVTGSAMTARLFPGVIAATVETPLAFQTAGRIATRPVDLGDSVAAGTVLATLDQVTLAEDVAAAEAGLSAARAEADFAAQSRARAEELHRRGVAPKATLEAAQAKDLSARAAVEAAEADLSRAQDAARYGTLTAPAAGIVSRILAEPGTVVSPGTPVLRLATAAGREAVIDVPDEVLAVLPEAAPFSIAARYEDALVTEGRLRLIEPVADPSTRAHRLRITLADEGRGLRLGALVSARLELPQATLLTLPRAAIWGTQAQPMVWRLDPERRARATAVSLGQQIGPRVVIRSGLAEGDEVAIRGIHSLTEGQQLGARVDP
ncbi:efflux RND transporter periplasmic adaptor subunit [Rhodobacter maris]|uniref:RND family efflux transporter MFP subunit n=1 Tax=Rhodobacter maris TaxID=446682 RepID=A0A285TFJ3_9RHOB|nr:efflux RND transporter periplasmic adaptor subunit [Rhodobacter maris]SOC18980.1 RND family efflux transporter MFP subunit [Rhodobacter maris]